MMRHSVFLFAALLTLLLFGCAAPENGTLAGKITVGPLCPVEPCGLTQEQIDMAYTSRSITIYASDRSTIITQMSIPPGGNYSIRLSPGTYFVTIRPGGIGDYPLQQVSISSGQTTTLNIDVDTGIR